MVDQKEVNFSRGAHSTNPCGMYRSEGKMLRRSTLDMMKADFDSFRNDTTSVVQQNQGEIKHKKVSATSHRRTYSILMYSLFGVSCLFAISFFFKDSSSYDDADAAPSNHRNLKLLHDGKHETQT